MSDELSKQLNSPADVLDAFCNLLSGLKVATPSLNLTPLQCWHIGRKAVDRITELEAQLADAQKDAARYQWLRNDSGSSYIGIYRDPHSNCRRYLVSTEADNFIDAAMQKETT